MLRNTKFGVEVDWTLACAFGPFESLCTAVGLGVLGRGACGLRRLRAARRLTHPSRRH